MPGSGSSNNRPGITRPGSGDSSTRPGVTRPGSGDVNRPGIARPGTGDGNRPSIDRPGAGNRPNFPRPGGGDSGFSRPSNSDLKDFLDLPGKPGGDGGFPDRTRPGTGDGDRFPNRPGTGDGDRLPNRPGNGEGVNIGGGDKVNIGGGDRNNINVNIGNKIGNRENNINNIRNKWADLDYDRRPFDRDWWDGQHHHGHGWHWHNSWNRYPNGWCWRPATWVAFGTWFTWAAWPQPYTYDYGTTVVYRDNYVYVNDQQYASADQYYNQAVNIAESVPEDLEEEKVEWMPLGVFAIAEESATDSGMMVQLAVSKEGIIAGTFYNDITGEDRPLQGMVDQKTQRAAWQFADGKNQDVVMETGIYNLTKDEATAWVHFGEQETQTWLMVRLPEPEQDSNQPAQ